MSSIPAILSRVSRFTGAFVAGLALVGTPTEAEVHVARTNEQVQLQNGVIQLAVSADGRSLCAFQYARQPFVRFPSPLYSVLLVGKDGGTTLVTSKEAREASVSVNRTADGAAVLISGKGFGGLALDVSLEIRVDATPLTRWRARVVNRSDLAVRSVTYPDLLAPRAIGDVPVFSVQDNLVKNPGFEESLQDWQLPGPEQLDRIAAALDSSVARTGKGSARIHFAFEENGQIYCPIQTVPVQPDTD